MKYKPSQSETASQKTNTPSTSQPDKHSTKLSNSVVSYSAGISVSKWFFLVPIFFFVVLITACTPTKIGEQINKRITDPFDETKNLNVHFVTTRREKGAKDSCEGNSFGFITDINPHYGICIVNVPAKHIIGDISSDNNQDKHSFFQFKGRVNTDEKEFLSKIKSSGSEEVLVFVHGFNVNFDEAVLRAGQIKYDLKFPGEVVVYSWPAGADAGLLGQVMVKSTYDLNFTEAKINREPFANFLKEISSTGKKIQLVVHSMGHQVVLPSIASLVKSGKSKFISELILNAPDFDKNEFELLLSDLTKSSERITLYCSPGDNALIASQKVNGAPRAGMCFKYSGVDVINVNEVDDPVLGVGGLGHGYYSSRPILTDIYQVLLGVSVDKRLFIRKSGPKNGENFVLRK
ncbi:alpha/beta hydrolase [Leptospira bouyouniensis]|uniref:alpha/beta hydrolase n=1 Tax=Leptospira bouyouniensis TaxID=2484911 RepID=UPI003CD0CB21